MSKKVTPPATPATPQQVREHKETYLTLFAAILNGIHAGNTETEHGGCYTVDFVPEIASENAKLALGRYLADIGEVE